MLLSWPCMCNPVACSQWNHSTTKNYLNKQIKLVMIMHIKSVYIHRKISTLPTIPRWLNIGRFNTMWRRSSGCSRCHRIVATWGQESVLTNNQPSNEKHMDFTDSSADMKPWWRYLKQFVASFGVFVLPFDILYRSHQLNFPERSF